MRHVVKALVLVLLFPLLVVVAAPAQAVDGATLRSFEADLPVCPFGVKAHISVGVAFDGTDLLSSCWGNTTITVVSAQDGHRIRQFVVPGISGGIGALAWDKGRGALWLCTSNASPSESVYLVTFDANGNPSAEYRFTPPDGCVDGLAYDGTTETLYTSGDAKSWVYKWTSSGDPLGNWYVYDLLGGCGNSGLAVGGSYLFMATPNATCQEIYRAPKDDLSSTQFFASYPSRLEDLECDDVTFASQGKAAIWSKAAYDNILNAFELNPGDCAYGGGGPIGINPPVIQAPAGSLVGLDITVSVGPVLLDQLVTKIVSGPNQAGADRLDCSVPDPCAPYSTTIGVQGIGGVGEPESTGVGTDTLIAWLDRDRDDVQDADEPFGTARIDWVRRIDYVGMGDSYSAGEGVDPYDAGTDVEAGAGHNLCHRSAGAYARLTRAPHLQKRIQEYADDGDSGTTLSFIACSGAVTDNLDRTARWTEPGAQFSRSVVNSGTDLVTLSIGGNDVGFGPIIEACALETNCHDTATVDGVPLRTVIDQQLSYLADRLPAVYADVRNTRAPGATIVAMGYPRLFPDTTAEQDCWSLEGAWVPLYDGFQNAEQMYLNEVGDRLAATIATAAQTAGVHYVDVRGAFDGHEVCGNGGEWLSGLTAPSLPDLFASHFVGSGAFHPNPIGQQAYAIALESYLASVTTPQNVKPTGLPANPQPASQVMARMIEAAAVPATQPWLGSLSSAHQAGDWQSACLDRELGVAGRPVIVRGSGYAAGATVTLSVQEIGGARTALGSATADTSGDLEATVALPAGLVADGFVKIEAVGARAVEGRLVGLAVVGVARPCPDSVAPRASITRPTGTYGVGQTVTAAYTCTDAESGVASCLGTVADGAAIDTATAGAKSFSVTATDLAGNTKTVSSSYTVAFGAPVVSSVSPSIGASSGGTPITILGYNFAPGSTVKVGTASATNVTVVSPTTITATTPAGTGTQAVTVTSTSGISNTDTTFTYQASGTYSLWYRGTINSKGKVVDSSGSSNPGTIKVSFGGTVKQVTDSSGDFLRFPLNACLTAPTNSSCPEAAINPSVVTKVNPATGTGRFEFGASARIASGITGTAGMNIFQRGNFAAGQAQWKLQVEWKSSLGFRVASCRFSDGTNATLVEGTKAIVPGTWYDLKCGRSGSTFTLTVNQRGGSTADQVVNATASIGSILPTLTPFIGAKEILTAKGKTDTAVDQFHGDLDDIFFLRY